MCNIFSENLTATSRRITCLNQYCYFIQFNEILHYFVVPNFEQPCFQNLSSSSLKLPFSCEPKLSAPAVLAFCYFQALLFANYCSVLYQNLYYFLTFRKTFEIVQFSGKASEKLMRYYGTSRIFEQRRSTPF